MTLPAEPPFPTTNPLIGSIAADTSMVRPDTTVSVRVIGDGIIRPGSYELPADSEIIDLVGRAGGLKPGAITDGLSWHRKLYDGLRLTIPTRSALREVRAGERTLSNEDLIRFRRYRSDTGGEDPDSDILNLNEADRSDLKQLNGIGTVLSGRIIDYRKKHDGFDSVSDLKNIYGIGDVTYQELRSKVTIE